MVLFIWGQPTCRVSLPRSDPLCRACVPPSTAMPGSVSPTEGPSSSARRGRTPPLLFIHVDVAPGQYFSPLVSSSLRHAYSCHIQYLVQNISYLFPAQNNYYALISVLQRINCSKWNLLRKIINIGRVPPLDM
jgi:hypothetical protein